MRLARGAGSKLKVGEHEFGREAPEKFFLCPPLYCRSHPVWGGGHCTHQSGHKDGQS